MDSKDLDRKINNFLHRKELEFPGLSLLGGHNFTTRHRKERYGHSRQLLLG